MSNNPFTIDDDDCKLRSIGTKMQSISAISFLSQTKYFTNTYATLQILCTKKKTSSVPHNFFLASARNPLNIWVTFDFCQARPTYLIHSFYEKSRWTFPFLLFSLSILCIGVIKSTWLSPPPWRSVFLSHPLIRA